MRAEWSAVGIDLARAIAARSSCARRRVGAAVIHRGEVVGLGFNGPKRGALNCDQGGCPRAFDGGPTYLEDPERKVRNCCAFHAEFNALSRATAHLGFAPYAGLLAVTDMPCSDCERRAWGYGIATIVWPNSISGINRWEHSERV